MITDLSSYGTGIGFSTWSLDEDIANLQEENAERHVSRARSLLLAYAPFDGSKANAQLLLTELIYNVAEQLFYRGLNSSMLFSPFKSERIGSYGYDKGNQSRENVLSIIKTNEVIWDLITYLQVMGPVAISTRVIHEAPVNITTGVRSVVLMHDDRVARAIQRSELISDTEQFDRIVYGDIPINWRWA